MTSDGSPYTRFRRALATGNLNLIRAAAAELPSVSLGDALAVCVLLRDREPHRFEQAAVRWLGRLCLERPDLTLADVRAASFALQRLREDAAGSLKALQELAG